MRRFSQSQLAGYVIGSLVASFVVNVLSATWNGHKLLWASLGVAVVVLVFVIPRDGLLRTSRRGRERWARLLALLLLLSYPVVVWLSSQSIARFWSGALSALVLLVATSLLLVRGSGLDAIDAGQAIGLMVLAATLALKGLAVWFTHSALGATPFLLASSITAILSLELLRGGQFRPRVLGVTCVLGGLALSAGGFALLKHELSFFGSNFRSVAWLEMCSGFCASVVGLGLLSGRLLIAMISCFALPAVGIVAGADLAFSGVRGPGAFLILGSFAFGAALFTGLLRTARLLRVSLGFLALLSVVYCVVYYDARENGFAFLIASVALGSGWIAVLLTPQRLRRLRDVVGTWLTAHKG